MYPSILVPLDGSALGEHALPAALAVARRTCATVHLVHIFDPTAHVSPEIVAAEHSRLTHYLENLALVLSQRWEIVIKTAVRSGAVAEQLRLFVDEIGADLMVMSTHGRSPLSRAWLGSVADTLVHQLPLPLLLVRPHGEPIDILETVHDTTFSNILVPLDGSPLAEAILEPASCLARRLDATLTLMQAVEQPVIGDEALVGADLEQQILKQRQDAAGAYLESVAEPLRKQGLRVALRLVVAQPAESILTYAHRHGVDLIAMATHGRSGLQRLVVGSVADRVVREAAAPVLLFRPSPEGLQRRADHARLEEVLHI